MTKREKLQLKNGKKVAKSFENLSSPFRGNNILQVHLTGQGWVNVTAPTSSKVISGVKRKSGRKYRVVTV